MRPRSGSGLLVTAVSVVLLGACAAEPTGSTPSSGVPPAPSSTSTGTGCPPTSLSGGPVTSQVVVVTTSNPAAASGSVLSVRTEIVVLSDAPNVVARPLWSALEVLTRDGVVARAVGKAGTDVPTALKRGTTVPAPTVPATIALSGCDGQPLKPGAYFLRALVGYGTDPLTNGSSRSAMRSEPVDLTVT